MIVRVTAEFLEAKLCTFPAEERRSFRFFFFLSFFLLIMWGRSNEQPAYRQAKMGLALCMCPVDWRPDAQDRIPGTLHIGPLAVRTSSDLLVSTAL